MLVVKRDLVAPAAFCRIQRDVRMAVQLGERFSVARVNGDSDRRADIHVVADLARKRSADLLAATLQQLLRADAGDDDDELVAADPRDDVAGARTGAQLAAYLGEDIVAGLMSERVVDFLEAVDVDEHERELIVRRRVGDQRIGPRDQRGPVRQLRERVDRTHRFAGLLLRFRRRCPAAQHIKLGRVLNAQRKQPRVARFFHKIADAERYVLLDIAGINVLGRQQNGNGDSELAHFPQNGAPPVLRRDVEKQNRRMLFEVQYIYNFIGVRRRYDVIFWC